ncbi:MAG: hypothetical protein Q7U34_08980, partial [Anaerolineales bacterium]|nr:hypothetical protein [Anaerolineales bacterium]
MTLPTPSTDRVLNIYLTLNRYPILSGRIRARMRQELFARGIISLEVFEIEVREKAIQSQTREGITNPVGEEPAEIWEQRLTRIRDQFTDLLFSQHLS